MRPGSRDLCVLCKGTKGLCGLPSCPLLAKLRTQRALPEARISRDVFGPTPPSIFVGSHGYPDVFWGPMVSLDPSSTAAGAADDPSAWFGLPFEDIVRFRSSLVRSMERDHVLSRGPLLGRAQDAILSTKAIDVEMRLKRAPAANVSFSSDLQPMGPAAPLEDFRVVENPVVPRRVDQLVEDAVPAASAVTELFAHGHDVYYLAKLLSSGTLGAAARRKMVPTRWSITATDDLLAKQAMGRIRAYPELSSVEVYSGEYLCNHFEILLMPGKWEYEGFEAWHPGTIWAAGAREAAIIEEHEPFSGRTKYADKQAGGYYAARFGVCEALDRKKKQARAVVFREIYDGYIIPVGVWEVRENVRHALKGPARRFSSAHDALADICARLKIPLAQYLAQSQVLPQARLTDY